MKLFHIILDFSIIYTNIFLLLCLNHPSLSVLFYRPFLCTSFNQIDLPVQAKLSAEVGGSLGASRGNANEIKDQIDLGRNVGY